MVFDRLKELNDRYIELEQRMEQPEVYTDADAYSRCARELKELEPVIAAFRSYNEAVAAIEDARSLMDDPEMKELAQDEMSQAVIRRDRLEHELQLLLLPKDPNDNKNVIMEIRGGVGGEEGMLFAHDLYRMYSMYAAAKGWEIEVANANLTELGGIKEISFIVKGDGAWSRLKYEAGGHRVQRVPVTESGGRIHTSAATVAVLPEVDDIDFKIDPKDLKIDTFRSSGAGGQHINKTESAIRVTHIPTGTVVECQDERSQYKNKDRALSILRSRLYEQEVQKQKSEIAAERKSQIGSGDRSDRVRTYNFPQNRVTDHRLNGEIRNFNIDTVINGGLDGIIDALTAQYQAEELNRQAGEVNQ